MRPRLPRLLLALVLVAPAAFADGDGEDGERAARAFFEPREPWVQLSLSGGVGGFLSAQAVDSKGRLVGHGGLGTLSGRVDVEAPEPLWISLAGRTFVGTPAEAELDLSVGYNFRLYLRERLAKAALDRLELRPLVGLKALRAADSVTAPTSLGVTALRFGGDFLFQSSASLKGVGALDLHLVGLWDMAREQLGIELEVRDMYPVLRPSSLGGLFVGLGVGYLPSTGGYGQLEFGVTWELGKQ